MISPMRLETAAAAIPKTGILTSWPQSNFRDSVGGEDSFMIALSSSNTHNSSIINADLPSTILDISYLDLATNPTFSETKFPRFESPTLLDTGIYSISKMEEFPKVSRPSSQSAVMSSIDISEPGTFIASPSFSKVHSHFGYDLKTNRFRDVAQQMDASGYAPDIHHTKETLALMSQQRKEIEKQIPSQSDFQNTTVDNSKQDPSFLDDLQGFFCVADGIGGWTNQGVDPSIFSTTLLKNIFNIVRGTFEYTDQKGSSISSIDITRKLRTAWMSGQYRDTFVHILNIALSSMNMLGSTTVTMAAIDRNNVLHTFNFGDSVLFLYRDQTLGESHQDQTHQSIFQHLPFTPPKPVTLAPSPTSWRHIDAFPYLPQSTFRWPERSLIFRRSSHNSDYILMHQTLDCLHGWNFPIQLSSEKDAGLDEPEMGIYSTIQLLPEDFIVMATDGITDNLFFDEIGLILSTSKKNNISVKETAEEILIHTRTAMKTKRYSPFGLSLFSRGSPFPYSDLSPLDEYGDSLTFGKMDDATTVVVKCCAS